MDSYNECVDIVNRYDITKRIKKSFFSNSEYVSREERIRPSWHTQMRKNGAVVSQKTLDFSYTDNDILQKKRELSVDLAKKIYNRISKDIDFDFQNKEHRKLLRPTEDDRDFVFNADLSMLDDDVNFVLSTVLSYIYKKTPSLPREFF